MGFFVRRVASAFLSTPRKGGILFGVTLSESCKSPRKQQAHQAHKRKRVVILYMYICRVQRFVPDHIDSYKLTFGSYDSIKKIVIFPVASRDVT